MLMKLKNNIRHVSRFIREIIDIGSCIDIRSFIIYMLYVVIFIDKIIKDKSLIIVDRKFENRIVTININSKIKIHLKGYLLSGVREIFCRKVYNWLPGFSIKPDDMVIDIGANVGLFTLYSLAYGARVVSVEAQSDFIHIIKENINNYNNSVEIIHGIVGSKTGVFSNKEARKMASHWVCEPPELSFYDIMKIGGGNKINFLKIDIEGSEFDLFSTNINWMDSVEKIAMEVHCKFGDVEDLINNIRNIGFNVVIYDGDKNKIDVLGNENLEAIYLFATK